MAKVLLLLQLTFITSGVMAQVPITPEVALSTSLIANVSQKLNITSPTDDYVSQNQRQYAANIVMMDAQLAALKTNYEQQLATITMQKELVILKLKEVDNKLYPLQFLSDFSKHCVQKYSWRLTTPTAAQAGINDCVTSALGYNFLSAATNVRNALNNYYNTNLVNALKVCSKNYINPSENYTQCAVQAISNTDAITVTNWKNFNVQLQSCQCSAESRVRTAVDCSFSIIYKAVFAAGEVTALVDNCLEHEECLAGPPDSVTADPENYCRNHLTLSDHKNDTIENPFYSLHGNITCVLLHLKKPVPN